MVIWLSADCYIKADDGTCFELIRRYKKGAKSKRAGEWATKPLGYYGTLEQAANGALNKAILYSNAEGDVREMMTRIECIAKQIADACEGAVTASNAAHIKGRFGVDELSKLLMFDDEE